MASKTAAQEEFDAILQKAEHHHHSSHPSDDHDYAHDRDHGDLDEDTAYHQQRIDDTMRAPSHSGGGSTLLHLPPREFDQGRTTGVKGVIADARSFQESRRGAFFSRSSSVRDSSSANRRASKMALMREDEEEGSGSGLSLSDDEGFLERWRQQRRLELQQKGSEVRTRRTSPSVRRYGRFDEVDALGYLDAIEKVARDTVVVVFVYDAECEVSQLVSKALSPLVPKHSAVHFVRVSYEDIEFDNAGVPAVLAYKNQGDLFANLTYIVDQLPADAPVDSKTLESVLQRHQVL